jgi:glycerophosphoryl diester phosphodiesterase
LSLSTAKPVPFRLDTIPNGLPVALSASETLPADSKRHSPIIVVGHRGCGKNNALSIGDVPGTRLSVRENTIKSFNLAASIGADYAEFDVQVTKDGHPVIFHDDFILSADGQVCLSSASLSWDHLNCSP